MKRFFTVIGCIAVVAVLGLAVAGCSNGSSSCDCPNGTLHLVDESCCSESDCVCERDVVGVRSVNGIAITKRTNVDITQAVVDNINMAIGDLAGEGYSADTLKKNVREITIVSGSTVTYNVATRTIYIGITASNFIILNLFADYLDEPGIVP